ncbi:HlyD family type I secretion periplasmic adaptor subunit [Polymorphobacter fuscus]|uniref:Membrane fusion protein (MFP) family protein n=1 Tax=Sandarakinorhabdus fusca TaxID=1439888 RepID=A0A7C9GU67_9SPHN|nr:HlyD family type I secretion periplasmic adaptor subunit [Polymorphobacter fuscus]KAB7647518.1 HlyD family type I secretion periplasmic adaptor subunit [Polymorphobacter fuscus]MQT16778.1 HlyD family type I secretion periplasmic adaptor subunit [Polymorphobacter fuscus]NJC09234.1 adhesin transport system membrane fusion protein [Polymorphobacter fuscus]
MLHSAPTTGVMTGATPLAATRIMLWSITGFLVAMIGWAAVAEVNETATAPGRIVPQHQLQVVSNLEGGVVTAIWAKPGQKVAAGQSLLQLDPAAAQADFGRSSAAANALRARIARLEAEVAGTTPVFPAALEAAAPGAVAAERGLWAARRRDTASRSAGGSARRDGADRALAEAQAAATAAAEARAQAAREVAMLAPLVDKGIEPRISLDRARSTLVQADAGAAGALQAVSRARAALAEAVAAMAGSRDSSRADAGNDLALARAELAAQSAALPAMQRRLERTDVRSPIAGIVQRVMPATIGGSIAPGAPLAEIVPTGGGLVVDVRVRPRDIAFVHIGQPAAVKLTAYDASVYGRLDGRVTQISPDAVIDDRGGEGWYQVRIATAAEALTGPGGRRLPVGAGMVADVDLLGPPRTVLSYLFSPIARLRDTAFRER